MTAPAFVQTSVNNTASGTSGTANKPTGVVDNDYLIMALHSSVQISSPTLSGWTNPFGGVRLQILTKFASSEPSSWGPSWTTSASVVITVIAIRNVNLASPILASAASETNLGNDVYTTAALTFSTCNYMYIALAAHASPNTVATPSGFTIPINTIHTNNNVQAGVGYEQFLNTANAGTVTWDYAQGGTTTIWSAALAEANTAWTSSLTGGLSYAGSQSNSLRNPIGLRAILTHTDP
jgi:hypothetical protein